MALDLTLDLNAILASPSGASSAVAQTTRVNSPLCLATRPEQSGRQRSQESGRDSWTCLGASSSAADPSASACGKGKQRQRDIDKSSSATDRTSPSLSPDSSTPGSSSTTPSTSQTSSASPERADVGTVAVDLGDPFSCDLSLVAEEANNSTANSFAQQHNPGSSSIRKRPYMSRVATASSTESSHQALQSPPGAADRMSSIDRACIFAGLCSPQIPVTYSVSSAASSAIDLTRTTSSSKRSFDQAISPLVSPNDTLLPPSPQPSLPAEPQAPMAGGLSRPQLVSGESFSLSTQLSLRSEDSITRSPRSSVRRTLPYKRRRGQQEVRSGSQQLRSSTSAGSGEDFVVTPSSGPFLPPSAPPSDEEESPPPPMVQSRPDSSAPGRDSRFSLYTSDTNIDMYPNVLATVLDGFHEPTQSVRAETSFRTTSTSAAQPTAFSHTAGEDREDNQAVRSHDLHEDVSTQPLHSPEQITSSNSNDEAGMSSHLRLMDVIQRLRQNGGPGAQAMPGTGANDIDEDTLWPAFGPESNSNNTGLADRFTAPSESRHTRRATLLPSARAAEMRRSLTDRLTRVHARIEQVSPEASNNVHDRRSDASPFGMLDTAGQPRHFSGSTISPREEDTIPDSVNPSWSAWQDNSLWLSESNRWRGTSPLFTLQALDSSRNRQETQHSSETGHTDGEHSGLHSESSHPLAPLDMDLSRSRSLNEHSTERSLRSQLGHWSSGFQRRPGAFDRLGRFRGPTRRQNEAWLGIRSGTETSHGNNSQSQPPSLQRRASSSPLPQPQLESPATSESENLQLHSTMDASSAGQTGHDVTASTRSNTVADHLHPFPSVSADLDVDGGNVRDGTSGAPQLPDLRSRSPLSFSFPTSAAGIQRRDVVTSLREREVEAQHFPRPQLRPLTLSARATHPSIAERRMSRVDRDMSTDQATSTLQQDSQRDGFMRSTRLAPAWRSRDLAGEERAHRRRLFLDLDNDVLATPERANRVQANLLQSGLSPATEQDVHLRSPSMLLQDTSDRLAYSGDAHNASSFSLPPSAHDRATSMAIAGPGQGYRGRSLRLRHTFRSEAVRTEAHDVPGSADAAFGHDRTGVRPQHGTTTLSQHFNERSARLLDEIEASTSPRASRSNSSASRPASRWHRYLEEVLNFPPHLQTALTLGTPQSHDDVRNDSSSQRGRRSDEDDSGMIAYNLDNYLSDEHFTSRDTYETLMRLSAAVGEARPKHTPSHIVACFPTFTYDRWRRIQQAVQPEPQLPPIEHIGASPDIKGKGKAKEVCSSSLQTSEPVDVSCAICLEQYEESDVIMRMPCKHAFHELCLTVRFDGCV